MIEHEHINASGRRPKRRDTRWLPCLNTSEHTIPSYGLMAIGNFDQSSSAAEDTHYANFVDSDGQLIWLVGRPDAQSVANQDPYRLCCNSEVPILPGKRGAMTQDWPAQTLHDGSRDNLPNGAPCGPRFERFEVESTGRAFTCLAHDRAFAYVRRGERGGTGTGIGSTIHTVWIAPRCGPSPANVIVLNQITSSTFSVGAGDILSLSEQELWGNTRSRNLSTSQGTIYSTERVDRLFDVHFSATVRSVAAPEGFPLRLSVVFLPVDPIDSLEVEFTTHLTAWRAQGFDTTTADNGGYYVSSPYYTAENIAAGGPLLLPAEYRLGLQNQSAYEIFVGSPILSAAERGVIYSAPRGIDGTT